MSGIKVLIAGAVSIVIQFGLAIHTCHGTLKRAIHVPTIEKRIRSSV